jgi:L-lactate dehydrogenase complex protein LldG
VSDNNQAAFMSTVRAALGHPQNVRRQAPASLFYKQPSPKSQRLLEGIKERKPAERQVLIDTLMEAARPINLDVTMVASPEEAAVTIAGRIASAPVEWGGPRRVCMWEHPLIERLGLRSKLEERDIPVVSRRTFFPAATQQVSANQKQDLRQGMVGSFVGVTSADFCVADTATLVLRTGPGQPRSVSLVASIHIAVITVEQILADFGELYASLRWGNEGSSMDLTTCMTFISGPSKTADIEATLVHGAHGPKAVWLYILAPK